MMAHNAAMQCYHHATVAQSFESRRENLNQASKLSRTGGVGIARNLRIMQGRLPMHLRKRCGGG